MSVLGTLLDVASLSVEIAMAQQLEEMQRQGATAANMRVLANHLKDQIFKYNESYKNIVAQAPVAPLQAAGALRLLQIRLNESGLSPDLFTELSDKEYVSMTFRQIKDKIAELTTALGPEDQASLEALVSKVSRLPDYNYYIENYDLAEEYKGQSVLAESTGNKTLGFWSMLGCGFMAGGGVLTMLMALPSLGQGLAITNFVVWGLMVAAAGFVARWGYRNYNAAARGDVAKKRLADLKTRFSYGRFRELDRELGGNKAKAIMIRDEGQKAAEAFFGDRLQLTEA